MRARPTILLLLALGWPSTSPHAEPPHRRSPVVPVDLAWLDSARLAVALRDGSAITVVDAATRRTTTTWPLPFRPNSLAVQAPHHLLVAGQNGEFATLDATTGELIQWTRIGRGPSRVVALGNAKALVGTRWDDNVRQVDAQTGRIVATHPLPFGPGAMVATPQGRVVVAAAMGGELADLVPGETGTERIIAIPGTSLAGISISGDGRELIVAHVLPDATGPITETNVDWGLIVSSKMSVFRLDEFAAQGRAVNVRRLTLDGSNNGAADPSAVVVARNGKLVLIALSGAHKILAIDRTKGPQAAVDVLPLGDGQFFAEHETGRSPVALAVDPTGRYVASADAMADRVTLIDLDATHSPVAISVGPSDPDRTAAGRGEALFRDGRLALDRWMSCATCHPAGHTIGRNFDTLGDGDHGDAKDTLSLLGVRSTAPFGWTGRFPSLEDQIQQSVESSMQGQTPQTDQISDLVAYLETLEPPPPIRPVSSGLTQVGGELFEARSCSTCHAPPLYTSRGLKDVGFRDQFDKVRQFNPPSLRGVGRSAPYLHDGRAKTLQDVLRQHHPGFDEPPDATEIPSLAAFLETL